MEEIPTNDSAWDDCGFRAWVEALATRQGRETREVCRTAGLAADYLTKHAAKSGRAISQLVKLATSLHVPVSALVEAGTGEGAAERADETTLSRLAFAANMAAHLYLNLDSRRLPVPADRERLVRQLIDLIGLPDRPPPN